ncbi:MAG: transglycosylase SLT domain-containing protein [Deltaproteobacteria bacterium]|nr:transglycosylase SLT domain-containing protein [Deltaproteobacteria bacterium]
MRPVLSITFFLLIMAAATDELAETKMSLSRVGAIHELPLRIKDLQSEIQNNPPLPPFGKGGMGGFSDEKILALGNGLAKVNPKLTIIEIYAICSLVEKYSSLQEIDPYLVMAIIIVESSGRSFAVSPKGAIGLMQVMPHMAEELGLDADLFDIDTNIRLGTFILADNIRRWGYHKGIERYFWGTTPPPPLLRGTGAADDRYIGKVLKTLEEITG